jgi:5'-nucleotidase
MSIRRLGVAALAAVSLVAGASTVGASPSRPKVHPAAVVNRALRVLVTNDDGVAAPGIDRVVERLRALPNVSVTVIAPATNQSGTGDKTTTTPLTVTNATTASGYPARAVNGYPADTVLLGVLKLLPERPDLVVSGINLGQNIADAVDISGTVGAARAAARLGIPAFAVSQGLAGTMDYDLAARFTAFLVGISRQSLLDGTAPVELWNLNVPSCSTGSVRGLAIVPVGRAARITGYTSGAANTYTATVAQRNLFASDCTSTKTSFTDDIDAMNNGYASLTQLDIDGTADATGTKSALVALGG